jgi:hypothetical protein
VNVRSERFRWVTAVNFTVPRNELVAFPDLESSSYASFYVVGKPLSITKLYTYKGINPENGIYEFVDENGDGSSMSEADRKFVHNFGRKYYGGLTNTISYKAFELSFLMQFVDQSSLDYMAGMPGAVGNQRVEALNRWQKPGDEAKYQLYSQQFFGPIRNSFYQFSNSNAAIGNSSFLRLKTLSLTYVVPSEVLKRARLESARIYLQGQNLFTVTDYSGLDPETGAMLPPLRIFTVGVQVKI